VKREPGTLGEILLAKAAVHARRDPDRKAGFRDLRAGWRLASRMVEFITLWAIYSRQEGRELTTADFCRLSGESRRTVQYWLSELRELFPELGEHATPQVFASQLPDASPARAMAAPIDVAALTAS
jgi:hypothetical protein